MQRFKILTPAGKRSFNLVSIQYVCVCDCVYECVFMCVCVCVCVRDREREIEGERQRERDLALFSLNEQWTVTPTMSGQNSQKKTEKFQLIKVLMKQYPSISKYRRPLTKDNEVRYYVLLNLNNRSFRNKHCAFTLTYRPAWTICSQHSDYHHSGPLHDIFVTNCVSVFCLEKVKFQSRTGRNCLERE